MNKTIVIDGELDISIPGFNNDKAVLRIDLEKCIVKRLTTGEEINFSTDANGYVDRNIEFVPSEDVMSDEEYMVTKVNPEDPRTWTCACPDFRHRRSGMPMTCKHIGYAHVGIYTQIT